ncbi:MAG: glycosyl transferase [Bacteroidetes bacterium GWC2_33_15]|nr:MAG: glycosyl transferase [Bacteroidetes bacterium GWA2_33_15]OFX50364.1 MAG: glycosyl transferase [Bacteroidetes bacterium GWC2_33_15]OFX66719.1 MAG: glycosyl transferase [Bacteroidetes bacterium GWB2_32_14]OFX69337.1 MAG: glycosyl transferase [Bacteroidetes bacterium GWD2_33_33]HAN18655.1 glycosyl transferase [Bacteroidales bacterium]
MKIAYLSTFYPFRGGIAQFNASLYRALEKEHEVKAFTFTTQYPKLLFPGKTQYVQQGDKADIINSLPVLNTINPLTYFKTAHEIKQWNPDILIMKYWMSFFGPSLGLVAKKMPENTKVITILDNVISHEKHFFDKPFTSFFLKQNDGFVVMSESVEKDLLLLKPVSKYIKHLHPIYNHFDQITDKLKAQKILGIPENKKVLLFFGFIRDYKGLDILIDSFRKLSPEYYLIIAGEVYGSFTRYQEQINSLPNKENIGLFVDYIPDDKVPLFFSAADVCILPYKSATQSGITYISFHFDLPIIATDVGGLRETISDKDTGLIVEQPDAEKLAEKIIEFFAIKDQISFKKNIARLKNELSWDHLAKSLIQFAESL